MSTPQKMAKNDNSSTSTGTSSPIIKPTVHKPVTKFLQHSSGQPSPLVSPDDTSTPKKKQDVVIPRKTGNLDL